MSRAGQRRLQKEVSKNNKTFNMTAETLANTIEDAIKRERERVIIKIVHEMNVVTAMVAHDKLGLGRKRLPEFLSAIMDMYDSMDKGYITYADMEKTLLEETGVEIK